MTNLNLEIGSQSSLLDCPKVLDYYLRYRMGESEQQIINFLEAHKDFSLTVHLPARRFRNHEQLENFITQCYNLGARGFLLMAGDDPEPQGPFTSTHCLLKTGLLKHCHLGFVFDPRRHHSIEALAIKVKSCSYVVNQLLLNHQPTPLPSCFKGLAIHQSVCPPLNITQTQRIIDCLNPNRKTVVTKAYQGCNLAQLSQQLPIHSFQVAVFNQPRKSLAWAQQQLHTSDANPDISEHHHRASKHR